MHGFFIVGQTISFAIRLLSSTRFIKLTKLFKTVSLCIALILLETSCSSQPTQKKITKKVVVSEDISSQILDAEHTVLLAQEMMTDDVNAEKINKSIKQLTSASRLYLQEKNYSKAIWLAEQTLQLNSKSSFENNNQQNQTYAQAIQLMLIKAKSYQALNYNDSSYQELEAISFFAKQHSLPLSFAYYRLKSTVLQAKNRAIASLQASLYALSLTAQQSDYPIESEVLLLWQKIKMLSPWQIELLTKRKAPGLDGWLQLNQYANQFGSSPQQFSRYITQWQRQYPNHLASNIALQLLQQNLTQTTIENIAIILPLTGKQNNAGLAVQQGILAAFEQENGQLSSEKTLYFVDSNTVDWQTLPAQFTEQRIDFVIGPLLKSHLSDYLKLNLTSVASNQQAIISGTDKALINEAVVNLPSLLLNLPNQLPLTGNQVAFSMLPEDEAKQAAASLSQVGFKQAIVLSHQDKVSKRIALAFVEQWQEKTDQLLEVVYFEQGKAMQNNLKASLDVNVSQSRIDELQNRLRQTIKAQTRNRRDVDMVYVVGNAEQTRLVKPYIDVNISPFSSLIPIYASSRSHSIKNDASSTNDLQGLTFTEMPWLLESTNQNKNLAKLSAKLWPKRHDSLSRIFAMGFDSYNLINKIGLMQQAPYIRHFGQTGVLQLNNNILTRSLIWGRYQQEGVSQIALD